MGIAGGVMSPAKWLLASFLTLILVGTGLLSLPGTTTSGSIHIIDALFTATTAVCVTGLMVLDIQRDFTPLGHAVVLGLIQCSGLGISLPRRRMTSTPGSSAFSGDLADNPTSFCKLIRDFLCHRKKKKYHR